MSDRSDDNISITHKMTPSALLIKYERIFSHSSVSISCHATVLAGRLFVRGRRRLLLGPPWGCEGSPRGSRRGCIAFWRALTPLLTIISMSLLFASSRIIILKLLLASWCWMKCYSMSNEGRLKTINFIRDCGAFETSILNWLRTVTLCSSAVFRSSDSSIASTTQSAATPLLAIDRSICIKIGSVIHSFEPGLYCRYMGLKCVKRTGRWSNIGTTKIPSMMCVTWGLRPHGCYKTSRRLQCLHFLRHIFLRIRSSRTWDESCVAEYSSLGLIFYFLVGLVSINFPINLVAMPNIQHVSTAIRWFQARELRFRHVGCFVSQTWWTLDTLLAISEKDSDEYSVSKIGCPMLDRDLP